MPDLGGSRAGLEGGLPLLRPLGSQETGLQLLRLALGLRGRLHRLHHGHLQEQTSQVRLEASPLPPPHPGDGKLPPLTSRALTGSCCWPLMFSRRSRAVCVATSAELSTSGGGKRSKLGPDLPAPPISTQGITGASGRPPPGSPLQASPKRGGEGLPGLKTQPAPPRGFSLFQTSGQIREWGNTAQSVRQPLSAYPKL